MMTELDAPPVLYGEKTSDWVRLLFGRDVWLVDEVVVEFSREREDLRENHDLDGVKGIAIGLGKLTKNDFNTVDWCLYISDCIGINKNWDKIIDKSNLMLLGYDIEGCDIYVCNQLWPFMFDNLERKRDGGCVLNGLDSRETSIRIANTIKHLYWCELFGGYYNEKQRVGQDIRGEIIDIDEHVIAQSVYNRRPRFIFRSAYLRHRNPLNYL